MNVLQEEEMGEHDEVPAQRENHRIAQVGKDLKDHRVQPQPIHSTLTLTTLR